MKDALKQLQDDPTPENAEQQRALSRQIEETKQTLKGLTDEYKEFGSVGAQKLKQAGQDMQNAGKKVQELGNGLTTHVTVPLLAVGAASTAAWSEVREGEEEVMMSPAKRTTVKILSAILIIILFCLVIWGTDFLTGFLTGFFK